jgi:hypothetical protein
MAESAPTDHGSAKPAPAKAPAPPPKAAAPKPAAAPAPKPEATPAAPKPAEHKAGAEPNRTLFKRSTYAGVTDTGPVPGETFEQKVARLKALSAAAKQCAEEGGEPTSAAAAVPTSASAAVETETSPVAAPAATQAPASAPAAASEHKATGKADRTLMKRSTYCGVVDTGPVPGETFQQKIARLTALSAAAKKRSEGG